MARKRETKTEQRAKTEETRRIEASNAHLDDLKRSRAAPPPDVPLAPRAIPGRVDPEPVSSGCGSPAGMCAELAK